MEFEVQLRFLQQLLKNLNVPSCIIEDVTACIPGDVDLGLRKALFGTQNYIPLLSNSFSQAQDRTIYRFYDEYACHYVFLHLTGQSYFFIGPYLLELPTRERIQNKATELGLSQEQHAFLERYYSMLPFVEDENYILAMTNTFASHLWGQPDSYGMEYRQHAVLDQYKLTPTTFANKTDILSSMHLENLERLYASENHLLEAVSKGKLHQVTAVAASVITSSFTAQRSDSLRRMKNDLIILKTLLRKAAEQGGVHPLHIHRLSEQYAAQIENIHTVKQCLGMQEDMIRSYCLLVKQHSLSRYSYYVGQVITLVQYDLAADLSLKTIAAKFNVNASYLSDLFRREYGSTLTEFITQERVHKGMRLLESTDKSVQEIASDCGIQSSAYYIKLFKKQTGMTPSQYRSKVR